MVVAAATNGHAQTLATPAQVLVVVNKRSPISNTIGRYYINKRAIPPGNLCVIDVPADEGISRALYDSDIEAPIEKFLARNKLTESILYIVTTRGVPLRVIGDGAKLLDTTASVDSELTLLYRKVHGVTIPIPGAVPNPFFQKRDSPFRHPQIPMYMVTRLDGYDITDIQGLIDRALIARNTGKFVIDLRADNATPGNQWLRAAALLLPRDRVVLDDTAKVLTGIKDVIGYASWGSNDSDHRERFLKFHWLPGAIATEFVSTDARTFTRPPDDWKLGSWGDPGSTMFFGSPQTVTGDYIHEGASGASGQVSEPYLTFCPRPDFILPAWFQGRNLAESFYMGIPGLSWMNVVIGDPLMRLR
jgi:uncharacterized protein (TIGR03790 family)